MAEQVDAAGPGPTSASDIVKELLKEFSLNLKNTSVYRKATPGTRSNRRAEAAVEDLILPNRLRSQNIGIGGGQARNNLLQIGGNSGESSNVNRLRPRKPPRQSFPGSKGRGRPRKVVQVENSEKSHRRKPVCKCFCQGKKYSERGFCILCRRNLAKASMRYHLLKAAIHRNVRAKKGFGDQTPTSEILKLYWQAKITGLKA